MIAKQFKRYLFDLDGVLYIGDRAEPYAAEAIRRLRALDKEIRFITNNPCTTREQTKEKLLKLNIEAHTDEVITASSATAQYVKKLGLQSVYLLADAFMEEEMASCNLRHTDCLEQAEAVVVGWSDAITFGDIRKASRIIRAGKPFIVAGSDFIFPLPDGPAPATGVIAIALEKASGVKPIVVGKPYAPMFAEATKGLLSKDEAVVIGDNLMTDIKGAHDFGLKAILKDHLLSHAYEEHEQYQPDARIDHLEELFVEQRVDVVIEKTE